MNFAPDIFAGRSAVVTGGATGIGWYIVRMLGRLGANVGIVSRKEENLVRASEQFKAEDGIDVAWRTGDVRDPDGIKKAIDELANENGGLDILVCNAAGNLYALQRSFPGVAGERLLKSTSTAPSTVVRRHYPI